MNNCSPIVLFTYNRPLHTAQVIKSLLMNSEAPSSDIIIYSDAPKKKEHEDDVKKTRSIIESVSGFRTISVVMRDRNIGLAGNIIEGVTKTVKEYGKAIVLEDDIVVSEYFLDYMNKALDKYRDEKKVWHISGWNYPISTHGLPELYFMRKMSCWGWATWSDRWEHFKKNPDELNSTWNKSKKRRFNIDGYYNFWSQIDANNKGLLNTWAIFWYATIFENKGLCLNPSLSYSTNIGTDGTGEHKFNDNDYKTEINHNKVIVFPSEIKENRLAMRRIKFFYLKMRLKNIISKIKINLHV